MAETIIDTIFENLFRYALVLGLTRDVYDSSRHRLVYSRNAHCYCFLLHIIVIFIYPLFLAVYGVGRYSSSTYHNLAVFSNKFSPVVYFLGIVLQWTLRSNVTHLFNEIFEIWERDIAKLENCPKIRRRFLKTFAFKALTYVAVSGYAIFLFYHRAEKGSAAFHRGVLTLLNLVFIGLMSQFSSFIIFTQYLVRILNHNLVLVLKEIRGLREEPTSALREKTVALEQRLAGIGRIHWQLQKKVLRLKDYYQIDILLNLLTSLLTLLLLLFIVKNIYPKLTFVIFLKYYRVTYVGVIIFFVELVSFFYICGQLLDVSREAGQIMKDFPALNIGCVKLERSIEMISIQFKLHTLQLRLCGMLNLEWRSILILVKTALVYFILLTLLG